MCLCTRGVCLVCVFVSCGSGVFPHTQQHGRLHIALGLCEWEWRVWRCGNAFNFSAIIGVAIRVSKNRGSSPAYLGPSDRAACTYHRVHATRDSARWAWSGPTRDRGPTETRVEARERSLHTG